LEYKDDGFVPDALVNFMVLLGWSLDGETEVMTVDTIRDNFALERVGKPAAIFDLDKLQWMNGVYIRQMSIDDLADQILPFLEKEYPRDMLPLDRAYLLRIMPLLQERLKTLADAPDMLEYFFTEELEYDGGSVVQRGMDAAGAVAALRRAADDLSAVDISEFHHEHLEALLREAGKELELSGRQFFGALRTAITGRTATPPLFEMMEVMGQGRVIKRLAAAVEKLSAD
jgi:glutamyl-tRNA synthetase